MMMGGTAVMAGEIGRGSSPRYFELPEAAPDAVGLLAAHHVFVRSEADD